MEPRDFANLSQADLIMRMGTDNSMLGKNWSKGRKGKVGVYSLGIHLSIEFMF